MQPPGVLVIDHINRNPLDNQKANLRICTGEQNHWNLSAVRTSQSGLLGVRRHRKRWQARLKHQNQDIHIGTFDTREEAAHAYNDVVLRLRGEFATLNVLED